LGIVAVLVVGICTLLSHIVIDRRQRKYGMGRTD